MINKDIRNGAPISHAWRIQTRPASRTKGCFRMANKIPLRPRYFFPNRYNSTASRCAWIG